MLRCSAVECPNWTIFRNFNRLGNRGFENFGLLKCFQRKLIFGMNNLSSLRCLSTNHRSLRRLEWHLLRFRLLNFLIVFLPHRYLNELRQTNPALLELIVERLWRLHIFNRLSRWSGWSGVTFRRRSIPAVNTVFHS